MPFPSGLHMHTVYGDGKNSPEEMILAAIDRGFLSVGISEHGFAPYDSEVCIPEDKMKAYRDEILALKDKYAGKIEVYSGVESDAFNLQDKSLWDYVIGSAHYVKSEVTGKYYSVDHSAARFLEAAKDPAWGGAEAMLRSYVLTVTDVAESYRPDILGHIDAAAKFNEDGGLFDENAPWYLDMWEEAIARIAKTGCVAELNSGAVSRGYKKEPYPNFKLLRMLRSYNIPVTISSDAHASKDIACAYEYMQKLSRDAGYNSVMIMLKGKFEEYAI